MALEVGSGAGRVRGGFVLPSRVYVDADGRPVPTGSPHVARLYAPAGAIVAEAEARRLGLLDGSHDDAELTCDCGYTAKTKAGLGAHQRRHKDTA